MKNIADRLVPRPREVKPGEGSLKWEGRLFLVVEPGNEEDRFAAETLVAACRERGLAAPEIIATQEKDEIPGGTLILAGDPCRLFPLAEVMRGESIKIPPQLADQGYFLQVKPGRILIAGNTKAGVYYGFQTLAQLLPEKGATEIPAVEITDWTPIAQRGISMDLSAGEVSGREHFKETIRRLGRYKLNLLVLSVANAFLFPSHPDISEGRDRLTSEEALELDAFARRHHVELVPCYDSPGHMTGTLSGPNYSRFAEGTEPRALLSVINVADPGTYPLLRDLYSDLCKAFPSKYNYMSGDEAFLLGWGKGRPLAERIGPKNMFVRHVKLIREILAEYGKRIVVAGDPFEPGFFKAFGLDNYGLEGLAQVPRDVIIGPWHYGRLESFPFGDQLREMGFDQYLLTSDAAYYQLFPAQHAAAANVESVLPHAHRLKALGTIHTHWNGSGENTFLEYTWPALAHYAEWAWESPGRPWAEMLPTVVESFYGEGTADLAETMRFLASTQSYFGWAFRPMGKGAFPIFFGPLEPRALTEAQLGLLAQFRRDRTAAVKAFERAKQAAGREREHLDFLEFALAQQETLGDLVESRHLLAQSDAASQERLREILRKLAASFPELCRRYEELWLRTSRPLGLEPNRKRFAAVQEAIQRELAARP